MTIRYTCTGCGSVLKIKDEKAGTEGHCPKCKATFRVPDLPPPADDLESPSAMVTSPVEPVAEPASSELSSTEVAATDSVEIAAPVLKTEVEDAEPILRMDDDDFDSPPMLSLSSDEIDTPPTPAPQVKDTPVAKAEVKPAKKKSKSKADDDFDPAEFLSEGAPPPKWTPPSSSKPSDFGMGSLSMDAPPPPRSSDSMKSTKPTPAPGSTAAAAAAAWDSKMAAKQMQKAIKDSRAEAQSAREEAEKADRFDWQGFFREFGLKGLAGLAGIVLLTYGAYLMVDRVMGSGVRLPPLGYVSGTVTLDGTPLGGATVYFAPQISDNANSSKSSAIRPRTSMAVTDDSGHYRMIYIDRIEGVAVGECRVWISKINEKGKQLVTGEFNEMNLTIREVKSGNQKYDFAMTSPPGRR